MCLVLFAKPCRDTWLNCHVSNAFTFSFLAPKKSDARRLFNPQLQPQLDSVCCSDELIILHVYRVVLGSQLRVTRRCMWKAMRFHKFANVYRPSFSRAYGCKRHWLLLQHVLHCYLEVGGRECIMGHT